MLLPPFLALCFLVATAIANTEKVIFTAPESISFGHERPNLLDLRLVTLSSQKSALRTSLPVEFPTHDHPRGLQSWYLLDDLRPGQRYEVRICWPATQPTNFWLETYNITHVFDTTSLIQGLSAYADDRQNLLVGDDVDDFVENKAISRSALFLQVWSAADFYTTDRKLMDSPPAVDVDIILDPFILNIFPQSLLPTAGYILVLAVGGWFLSGFVWERLQRFVQEKEHAD